MKIVDEIQEWNASKITNFVILDIPWPTKFLCKWIMNTITSMWKLTSFLYLWRWNFYKARCVFRNHISPHLLTVFGLPNFFSGPVISRDEKMNQASWLGLGLPRNTTSTLFNVEMVNIHLNNIDETFLDFNFCYYRNYCVFDTKKWVGQMYPWRDIDHWWRW